MQIKKAHLIVNPAAGKKNEDALQFIQNAFRDAGVEIQISITQKAGDAHRFSKNAVKNGVDVVAVCGGDGTLKEAAEGIIGTAVSMLILPAGSANVLATELNIPKDLKELCAVITRNDYEAKRIDVAETNHGLLLVRANLGFTADVVKDTHRDTKNKFGKLAYFMATFHSVKKMKLVEYDLKIDGTPHHSQGLACMVTNAGNIGFAKISLDRGIDVSDGLLDVLILKKANINLLKHILTTLLKKERPDDWSLVSHWQGKNIDVVSTPVQQLELDGEILEKSNLRLKILPAAITVLVPRNLSP